MAGEKLRSEEKQERLAKALKANLARRKAQARTRTDAPEAAPTADAVATKTPPDEDGCPN